MRETFTLFPEAASQFAPMVDHLYYFEVGISVLMTILIFMAIFVFAIKYRRRNPDEVPHQFEGSMKLEIAWSVIPFIIMLVMCFWGASVAFQEYAPPINAYNIYVVGKQWMWKVQYPEGNREINEMHVPIGRQVRVTLASEDVIHSFFIPAFRVKHDAVPGTYETLWFKATKTGTFKLECSEFCGTQHAHMKGEVIVVPPADYAAWLTRQGVHESLAEQGEALFRERGCSGCHGAHSTVHAPALAGLWGSLVHLQDGSVRRADEQYIRDCILEPRTFTVAGYPPVMPSFAGQLGEDELLKLVAYIRSLAHDNGAAR